MERLVAYCGLVCSDCPAYIATQADDLAAKERVLAQWRAVSNDSSMTVDDVTCDGCTTVGGRGRNLPACPMRLCGMAKGVAHCGECADYACHKLDGMFARAPSARAVLDELRQQR